MAVMPLLCLSAGCGSSESTVTGKVTFDGKPVDNGAIRFRPISKDGGAGAVAKVDGGEYRVDGLRVGDYRVQITAERKTGQKIRQPDSESGEVATEDEVVQYLPLKYNAKTTLNAVLKHGDNVQDFALER